MDWMKKNWLWIVLLIPALFLGYEIVAFLWASAARESSSTWLNKLKFWGADNNSTTGPAAAGSNCGGQNEAASCVPASARTAG